MNPHLDERVLTWGPPEAAVTVLAVHGRGQEPEFMRELATRFGPLPARFVAPAAAGGSWYPLPFLQPLSGNQPHLDESLAAIEARVDALSDVVLFGFSQGACLLAHLLLTRPRRVAAAVLFTGGFIGPDPIKPPTGAELDGVPVVLRSIEDDPWVPAHRVVETGRLFEAAGARLDLKIEPGTEHIVTDEACAAAADLIRRLAQL
ncbi:phospholipase/carboxylesterase [Amycolatopsis tolypomycina]|uniref:Phospholipase/carboxylesterase n=1 Tax=Amycolatopsis tolypomycina TaxID=208445 RepID=A0A1H4VFE1_9PSEU|nr:phospholipase [Amycolatopsis tolypomycina]SEC79717.1 phospholipase/carboxylesterase [Amycolatopsis tolypomycina]